MRKNTEHNDPHFTDIENVEAALQRKMLTDKLDFFDFITAEKGGVARAKGEGEKEKECTTECKSRRQRDEKAP